MPEHAEAWTKLLASYRPHFKGVFPWSLLLEVRVMACTDQDPCHHMSSLGHNKLSSVKIFFTQSKMSPWSSKDSTFVMILVNSTYCQICNIRRTQSPNINVSRLVLQLYLPNPLKPGVKFMGYFHTLLTVEWRCSWSSADRRCSNDIWMINNFIAD